MPTIQERKEKGLEYLKSAYGEDAIEFAISVLKAFKVETPAWGYWVGFGGEGDRFSADGGNYNPLGAARNAEEIAQDAAVVHELTGCAPRVGAHVLWQLTKDGKHADIDTAKHFHNLLKQNGLDGIGSVSPTYFIGPMRDGSFTAQDPSNREVYIDQTVEAAKIANIVGSNLLTLWFPDGTNLPGQRELQDKKRLMRESLVEVIRSVPKEYKKVLRVLVEYKLFEPGTYSTTIDGPLASYRLAQAVTKEGAVGGVLIDLGHHSHGVNVENNVADVIDEGMIGGLHFNCRYAADDDHSVEPNPQIARIFHELLYGNVIINKDSSKNWAYALDQMLRGEERIPAILKSIEALKILIARAALYGFTGIKSYQVRRDLVEANRAQESALLLADTRPIMWLANEQAGKPADPIAAYLESGYQQKITAERNKPL